MIESSRGSQRVASLPVLMNVRYKPSGPWAFRPTIASVQSNVEIEGWPSTGAMESDPAPGVAFVRTWELWRVDLGFEFGFDHSESEGDDEISFYRRNNFFAGLSLAYPSGSRLKVSLAAGFMGVDLYVDDIGPSGEDGDAFGDGPYYALGLSYALARRLSIELRTHYHSWDGEGMVGGMPAEYETTAVSFGLGFLVHY